MGQLNQSMHALRLRRAVDGTAQSVHACSQAQAGGGWDRMDLYLVNVPMKRLIMLTRNNAELTFEPQFAPPQCILWAIFGGFPGFLRVPGKPTEK